jgi:hypothetical protein
VWGGQGPYKDCRATDDDDDDVRLYYVNIGRLLEQMFQLMTTDHFPLTLVYWLAGQ